MKDAANRFWDKVKRSRYCWIWGHSRDSNGYGTFSVDRKPRGAHRVSWQLTNGDIPAGMCVLHKCDNPACVNPQHLFLGTKSDNTQDCLKKGRHPEARKTHCIRGHAFTPENTLVIMTRSGGKGRDCRTCQNARSRAWQHKNRKKLLSHD